jgi:PII-like signaling protein
METVRRKRLEILTDAPLVPRVVAALRQVGIANHTVHPVLSGAGRSGEWNEERLTGATKQWVMAITSEEKSAALVDAIGPMLDSYHLLLTIGDVEVVRGERF